MLFGFFFSLAHSKYVRSQVSIDVLVFLFTATSSLEAFCLSETENLEVLSDSFAQMRPIQLN